MKLEFNPCSNTENDNVDYPNMKNSLVSKTSSCIYLQCLLLSKYGEFAKRSFKIVRFVSKTLLNNIVKINVYNAGAYRALIKHLQNTNVGMNHTYQPSNERAFILQLMWKKLKQQL